MRQNAREITAQKADTTLVLVATAGSATTSTLKLPTLGADVWPREEKMVVTTLIQINNISFSVTQVKKQDMVWRRIKGKPRQGY